MSQIDKGGLALKACAVGGFDVFRGSRRGECPADLQYRMALFRQAETSSAATRGYCRSGAGVCGGDRR